MTEYRFVSLRKPASKFIPHTTEDVSVLTLDFASSIPELGESMDGWEAVGFQITPFGDDLLLTFLLRTDVNADDLLPPKL